MKDKNKKTYNFACNTQPPRSKGKNLYSRNYPLNLFPRNQRGFLLGEETLKIVIAVICIVFLIYLLVAVYFNTTGQEKLKQAESILKGDNGIVIEMNRVNSGGEYDPQGFHVPNPPGWFIFSFIGEDKKPNSCIGKNCICICEEAFPDLFDWQLKRCDEKGTCANIENLAKFAKIKIEKNGINILIQKVNEQIEIKRK